MHLAVVVLTPANRASDSSIERTLDNTNEVSPGERA